MNENRYKACRCPKCLHGGRIDIEVDDYVTTYRNRYYHRDCLELEQSERIQQERKDRQQQSRIKWNAKNVKTYTVNLNYDKDKHIIDYIEAERQRSGKSFAQIIRDIFDEYIQ